jgi:hypothetical protein
VGRLFKKSLSRRFWKIQNLAGVFELLQDYQLFGG